VKETDGRNPFDIHCAHIRFYDETLEQLDPQKPQLAQKRPLRRSPLRLVEPDRILSQALELASYAPGRGLILKKSHLN